MDSGRSNAVAISDQFDRLVVLRKCSLGRSVCSLPVADFSI